jgi:hypothetical protein
MKRMFSLWILGDHLPLPKILLYQKDFVSIIKQIILSFKNQERKMVDLAK